MQRVPRTILAAVLALACVSLLPGQGKKDKEDPTVRSLQGQVVDPDDKPAVGAVVQLKDTRTLQVRSFWLTGRHRLRGESGLQRHDQRQQAAQQFR
jgi:hypothetical protein